MFAVGCAVHKSTGAFGFRVQFNQAVDLKAGDQVRMLGVQVGKVKRISVAQSSSRSQPVVDVAVLVDDPKVQVRKADTIRMATEGLLGPEYLEIDPATVQSLPIAPGSTVTGEPEEAAFSPKLAANLQPLLEIASKLAALPPAERKLMMDKFLKLLDQASKSSPHGTAVQSSGRIK